VPVCLRGLAGYPRGGLVHVGRHPRFVASIAVSAGVPRSDRLNSATRVCICQVCGAEQLSTLLSYVGVRSQYGEREHDV
jgi:hypothetical protein